jgi:hypothetical protein
MMSGAAGRRTVARMFEVGEPVDLRAEHLQEGRDASKRVLYTSFLDALRREEQAAKRVERDAAPGSADPGRSLPRRKGSS